MTGLTIAEFRVLLAAFETAYRQVYPSHWTVTGHVRRRWAGAGRPAVLATGADKLLFILVYLKTYPLQVVLGQLFGLSTAQANYWLHRLLPIVRRALEQVDARPEREGARLGERRSATRGDDRLIIDATERRRQRPKNPEKQARHYSGKKKAHTDKNVVVARATDERVLFLSSTHPGSTHDKRIADEAGMTYPPGTTLSQDAGFQGYEPEVQRICRPKKKATGWGTDSGGETCEPTAGAVAGARGACGVWRET